MYLPTDRHRPVIYVRLDLGPTFRAAGRAIALILQGFILGLAAYWLIHAHAVLQ